MPDATGSTDCLAALRPVAGTLKSLDFDIEVNVRIQRSFSHTEPS